jgi:hypothetical protein
VAPQKRETPLAGGEFAKRSTENVPIVGENQTGIKSHVISKIEMGIAP